MRSEWMDKLQKIMQLLYTLGAENNVVIDLMHETATLVARDITDVDCDT
jgi:hypothetical protein